MATLSNTLDDRDISVQLEALRDGWLSARSDVNAGLFLVGEAIVPQLAEALDNEEARVRQTAFGMLSKAGFELGKSAETAAPSLIKILTDAHEMVHHTAIIALKGVSVPEAPRAVKGHEQTK